MRILISMTLLACGGPPPIEESPPAPVPEPVPPAPPSRTVQILAVGEPVEGVAVAFNDPESGELFEVSATSADGIARGPDVPEAVVSVLRNATATSFFDLPDGAIVDVGYPGTGDAVRDVSIVLEEEFSDAVRHRATAGCGGPGPTLEVGVPVEVYALEPCWRDSGTVDVVAIAVDAAGDVLAASTVEQLPIPQAGNGAILPPWTTDLERVAITWEGEPGPPLGLRTHTAVGHLGHWYPLSTQFGRGSGGRWSAGLAPVGFADALEIAHEWRGADYAVSRLERRDGVPAEVVVPAEDFAVDLEGLWDPETSTLLVSVEQGPEDPVLAVFAQLQLSTGEGVLRTWNLVGPPEREAYVMPVLPENLRSFGVVGLVASIVAVDPSSFDAVGRHWATMAAHVLPVEVEASVEARWLAWSTLD